MPGLDDRLTGTFAVLALLAALGLLIALSRLWSRKVSAPMLAIVALAGILDFAAWGATILGYFWALSEKWLVDDWRWIIPFIVIAMAGFCVEFGRRMAKNDNTQDQPSSNNK